MTSPVERISGPSRPSEPWKRSNGSTASLTQMWSGVGSAGSPRSAIRSPSMTRHAILASGTPVALRDERHGPRGARVGLDHVDVVLVERVLHVHQPDDAERERDVPGQGADLVERLAAERVRRQHAGGVAGVDAGLLDVLHDPADPDVFAVAERVDVDLDRVLHEAVEEDLALGADTVEVALEPLVGVHDLHRAPAEHVAGSHEQREADARAPRPAPPTRWSPSRRAAPWRRCGPAGRRSASGPRPGRSPRRSCRAAGRRRRAGRRRA